MSEEEHQQQIIERAQNAEQFCQVCATATSIFLRIAKLCINDTVSKINTRLDPEIAAKADVKELLDTLVKNPIC